MPIPALQSPNLGVESSVGNHLIRGVMPLERGEKGSQSQAQVQGKLVERMRAPVREAFSYGIRHWIRHIHCDSMSYDQIRVKP